MSKSSAEKVKSPTKAFAAAIKLLSLKARSSHEVETRLREKGFAQDEVERALERLASERLIDDYEFARSAAESLSTRRLWGSLKIRHALKQRGVPDAAIRGAVEAFGAESDLAAAAKAFKKWLRIKGLKAPLETAERLKAARHLASKGFPGQIVSKTLGAGEDSDFE